MCLTDCAPNRSAWTNFFPALSMFHLVCLVGGLCGFCFCVCLGVCCCLGDFFKNFYGNIDSDTRYNIYSADSHGTSRIVVRSNWYQPISAWCYKHTLSFSALHSPHMQETDSPLLGKNKISGRIFFTATAANYFQRSVFIGTNWHSFSIF